MVKKGKKPNWVVEKERGKRGAEPLTVWLFGHHAVRDALVNPARKKIRLILNILQLAIDMKKCPIVDAAKAA